MGWVSAFETPRWYYIADMAQKRWTRLSKELVFQSSTEIPTSTGWRVPFSDGSYLTAGYNPTRSGIGLPLHITSADGREVFSFGGNHLPKPEVRDYSPPRLTLSGDTTIWLAHADHYRIERWTTKGDQVAIYERPNPWLPTDRPASSKSRDFRIFDIRLDQQGLLWVYLASFKDKKSVIEVLDLKALSVLASITIADWIPSPAHAMSGFRSGYFAHKYRETDNGEPFIDVFAFELRR